MTIKADWIAVDWGTSNMRAWAMSATGTVLAEGSTDKGMGKLTPDEFEPTLLEVAGDWINGPTTVMACGMVGAKQGWTEAPYAVVPCPAMGGNLVTAPTQNPDLSVHIIPGVKQATPADVMRGEETQIAGFLARNPGWHGVICLPGTHTKWVHISANEIVSFQTFMTGELFEVVSKHTVLRHSVTSDDWDQSAFDGGLSDGMARPERIAANLFSLRAQGLLDGLSNDAARARLSGLLIGAELAAAKPYWLGQQIAVIGAGGLSKIYVDALAAQSAPATQVNGSAITLAGLTAAYRALKN
jgi:2-dehydro-3-deoxygalactonokinase